MEEEARLILRDTLTESEGAEEQTGIGSTDGKRRRQLLLAAEAVISQDFHNRVLVFDADAAVEYAAIVVKRERSGRPSCSVSGYKTGW